MLFWKLLGAIAAKVGLGFSLLFSPVAPALYPTPLVLAPEKMASSAATPAPVVTAATSSEQAAPAPTQVATPKSAPVPKPEPVPVPAPVVVTPPEPAPLPLPPGSDLNDTTRAALVNILCTTKAGGYLKPISGSGVIIDSRGVILTNAHVGQFLLLKDYLVENNVTCVIRTGSPARTLYTASLLYFPPAWLRANARKITQEVPTGTGQHDYAFLLITGRTDPAASLPSSFPSVRPSLRSPEEGEPMLLAAYPAGFLGGATAQTNLYASTANALVGDVYTFNPNGDIDLFSIGGTILSQHGSSGGAAVAANDAALLGIIATATAGESTADRDLRAITLSHIDQSYAEEAGERLADLLSGDLSKKARAFNVTIAPSLTRALIEELEK